MTKVEELRETIVACVADSKAILSRQVAEQFVDSLISAAEAQGEAKGRAEGAEQEAAKVVHCYECVGGDENTPEKEQCVMWTEGKKGYCSRGKRVPASVLAPAPKEGEHGKS